MLQGFHPRDCPSICDGSVLSVFCRQRGRNTKPPHPEHPTTLQIPPKINSVERSRCFEAPSWWPMQSEPLRALIAQYLLHQLQPTIITTRPMLLATHRLPTTIPSPIVIMWDQYRLKCRGLSQHLPPRHVVPVLLIGPRPNTNLHV